uniref:Small integral membrane protein 12 n=1 Tax=Scophthalmus maximus TaxID=52904 RepID=A0A8D3B2W7_SCOMX
MWPLMWAAMRTYAPYVTFPVTFVVGAVGYHLEWFIRGTPKPREEEMSILELREERKLQEQPGLVDPRLKNRAHHSLYSHISEIEDGRRGHEDDLEDKVAKVGNGEGSVVADGSAARLTRVADEVGLLVVPGGFCGSCQYQHAKQEEYGEPDTADACRVLLALLQQVLQEGPVSP